MREMLTLVGGSPHCSIFTSHHPIRHHHCKPILKSSSLTNPSASSPSSPTPKVSSSVPRHFTVRWDCHIQLQYFASLASQLAYDGRLQEFTLIIERAIVSGASSSLLSSALNFDLVAKGVSRNLRQGKIETIIEVLKRVTKLGVAPSKLFDGLGLKLLRKECKRILNCAGEVKLIVSLMEIIAEDMSVKELVDPSAVVKLCVAKRNPNLAIRYACTLPYKHIICCNIISEFGKKRDLVSALRAFGASKEKLGSPNMHVFRTIIDTCGRCGDFMRARQIYEDLIDQKITPNIYVFNSLMNVNAHDLNYTYRVYKDLQTLGVKQDIATYNILLKACCLASRIDLAQDIYFHVKHLESPGSLKLDIFTYCTIIKVLADAKQWETALQVKEEMLKSGVAPNLYTWSSLISACANAGLVDQAFQLFSEMLLAGCVPNSQCCNILLNACVEACQFDRAFRLFEFWKGFNLQEKAGDYIHDREKSSSGKHMQKHFRTSVSNSNHSILIKRFPFKPTTTTYNIMMKACGTDCCRAQALMDDMKAVGVLPDHITWTTLIDIYGTAGNISGALQMLKTMRTEGIQPDVIAYTTAIKICVENKTLQRAFSLFKEMKRYQIQPNLVTYNTLLRARSRYGYLYEVQQCLAIYCDMRRAGFESNNLYLKELIEEWCEGVIQDNNKDPGELASRKTSELGRSHSLLLETVAAHLQKSNTKSTTVDIQGLTKVEARILVLAVLRMIKEKYYQENLVADDIWIVLGGNKVEADPGRDDSDVEDEITGMLRNELGLEVLVSVSTSRAAANDGKIALQTPLDANQQSGKSLHMKKSTAELAISARRPVVLQRLKVTKKSLICWLKRTRKVVHNSSREH